MATCIATRPCPVPLSSTTLPFTSCHVAVDLPCPEDKDNEPLPKTCYLPKDIFEIQRILGNFVPPEIADTIIEEAEIWPYVSISRNTYTPALTALEGTDGNAQWCYLVSPRVPSLDRNGECLPTAVRKVKFYVKGYNSCWGGEAEKEKNHGLKTWLEASILKANDPETNSYLDDLQPHDWFTSLYGDCPKYLNGLLGAENVSEPQLNPFDQKKRWTVIDKTPFYEKWHEVVWVQGQAGNASGFVDALSVGDRIVLLVRALTPGWIKTVFNVKMEIYYSLPVSVE